MNAHTALQAPHRFQVYYRSLFGDGHAMAFPCDAEGRVDLDGLSERARANYLAMRGRVGRDFATPEITACETC